MKSKKLTGILFAVYLAILTWIILLKMQTDLSLLASGVRAVNWIPFAGALVVNGRANYQEVFLNLLVFVPFGLYLSLWKPAWPVWKRVLAGFLTSLAYEVLQYVFALGRSDVTDLLSNTLGCLLGAALYPLLSRGLRDRTVPVLNAAALGCTVLAVGFLGLLVGVNG